MAIVPESTAQAVQRASQATELYVGIGSPAELEVVDAVTGEEVGSPVSLAAEPLALSYWSPVSADPGEVAIAENGDFQVFNPTTGSLTAAASLSFKPSAVAVAAVTSTQQYALVVGGSSPGKVSVINLDDNPPLVVQTFALGFSSGAPSGMAVNTSGTYAFVTDPTSHQIETLEYVVGDPFTISSTYKNSSLDPSSIIFSVADAAIFYSTGDDVDESSVPSGTVSAPSEEISIAESGTSCTSSLSAGALVNDPDGSSSDLYVQEVGSDNVGDVSTTNDDLSACMTAPTFAGGSLAFVNDGGILAAASASGSSIDLIGTNPTGSPSYDTIENVVSLPGTATAMVPAYDLTLDPQAYVAEAASNEVAIVNLQGSSYVAGTVSLPTGSEPEGVAVSPNGEYVYVTDYGTNKVSVIEPSLLYTPSGALIASIALPSGAEPDALAFSPDGDQLLVDDYGIGKISIIDTNPNDGTYDQVLSSPCVLSSCSSSAGPDAIAFSPSGAYAYVADHVGDLSIFTQSGGSYALAASQGSLFTNVPTDVVIAPNDETAYVTDELSSGDGYLDEFSIDPANGEFESLNHVTVGTFPGAVTLSSDGATAYVADWASQYVSVVTLATGAVTNVSVSSSSSNSISYVDLTPDSSDFVATAHGNPSTVYICATSDDDCSSPVDLGDNTSGDLTVAVGPAYYSPATQSVAGDEDDVNPSVAASSQVDIEDGVDTSSGSYTFNQDDLSLPDIGLSLDLSQEYDSSNAATNGPLGYGWSFSYGMTADQVPDTASTNPCAIVVTQENGTPAVFDPPAWTTSCPPLSSSYQPPTWEQASLSTLTDCNGTDSCWDMRRDNGTQYLIDQTTGDLISETDRNNNKVILAYSGGKLSTVTGESGVRQLSFTWTGNNITEVTDSAGRTAAFGYSNGNLTSLTLSASSTLDPTTHEWAFSYNSSHQLTDWWSPDNEAAYAGNTAEATQIAYNGAGQVTSVTDPAYLTQCNGSAGPPYCAPETTFSYPSFDTTTETGTVLVADPNENYDLSADVNDGDGNVTLDRYSDGVLVQQVQGYGYETSTTSPYDQYAMATDATATVPDPYVLEATELIDGDGNLTTTNFDMMGNPIYVTDPMGNVTITVYNSFNEVEVELYPNGVAGANTFDFHGNELTSTNRDGDVTSYAYNSNGEMCAMLSPDGYAAPNYDRLTSCPSGPAPYVTAYGYDAEGDQTSVTTYDGTNNTASETYVTTSLDNAAGEECSSLSADGYAAGDRAPGSCPTSGAAYETVNTAFDVFGNVLTSISPTNASGGTTTTAYDADGNELTTTDPAGDVTTSTYDPDDQLCWTTPSASSATCGSPPTGAGTETTTYGYDPDGNQVASVAPDGNVNTIFSCLYETTSTFDNLGKILSETTPAGGTTCANENTSTTKYTFDPDGHRLTEVEPPPPGQTTAVTTTSTYNQDGELCWTDVAVVSDPTCASVPSSGTSYTYDADGNELTVTDPSDDVFTSTYDPDDKPCWTAPISVSNPKCASPPTGAGTETTTDYIDADGNQVATTGPNGNPYSSSNPTGCNALTTSGCADTTYNIYDEQSRELSTTDPSGNETQYTYDADGNMLTETAPDRSESTYNYNGAGQVTQISYTDGTPTVSYQYSANGERCWMYQGSSTNSCSSPPAGATTYSYDTSGRLVSETNSAGATVTYGYDASSNLACLSYPNSLDNTCSSSGTPTGVVRYAYDQANQLTSLTDWAGDTLTFTYNGNGQQCWVSTYAPSTPTCASPPYQSGAVTTNDTFDTSGNVSDLKTTTGGAPTNLLDLAVGTRSPDEFIEAETPTVGTTVEAQDNYAYNDIAQVSSGPITGSSGSTTYQYLPTGSITDDTTAFQSAAYTAAGALCWTYTGTSTNSCGSPPTGATVYTTNTDGELTGVAPSAGNPTSYGWETESGLLTCANTDGSTCSTSSPTSTTTVYTYDGDGLRMSAAIGSTTTSFTWGTFNDNSNLLSDGTWDYIYANGSATPIEQISRTGSSPTADLLLRDESGNVRGLVQLSAGAHQDQLVNYTDYDAYGDPITGSGGTIEAGGITTPQTSLNPNFVGSTPWGFGEGYTDPTGLVFLVHRSYDPNVGQFLSVDPLVAMTNEAYQYGDDNPVNRTDPAGTWTLGLCAGANGQLAFLSGIINLCAVMVMSGKWAGHAALTLTVGGGFGAGVNAEAGAYIQLSSSNSIDGLGGWFGYLEVNAAFFGGAAANLFVTAPWEPGFVYGADLGGVEGFGIGESLGFSYTFIYRGQYAALAADIINLEFPPESQAYLQAEWSGIANKVKKKVS
jgi:RHS repeat-associated protein